MSFFSKLFGKKQSFDSPKFRKQRAEELHGKAIKYVTEHVADNEDVVGRGGSLCYKDGDLIIDTSGDRLFVCAAEEVEASYLMSGDGVIIKGKNKLEGGKFRCLTVHFVYYRK